MAPADSLAECELTYLIATGASEKLVLEYIQNVGIDLGFRDNRGRTVLHYASQYGRLPILRYLLSLPVETAQLNLRDRSHEDTALILAARNGHRKVVKALVEAGSDVDMPNKYEENLLYLAILRCDVKMTRFALDHGASLRQKLRLGITPLSCAILQSEMALVRLLIERGADTTQSDECGARPLSHAVSQRSLAAAKVLLNQGADPFQYHEGYEKCRMLGHTPFDLAIMNKDTAMVQLLLDRSAGLEHYESHHPSTLCAAVERNDFLTTKLLLERGANVRMLGVNGLDALQIAVKYRYLEIAILLASNGVGVLQMDSYDWW